MICLMRVKRITSLDGLRFLMALTVVFAHVGFLAVYSLGENVSRYFLNPFLAVDFFFLLSGFGLFLAYSNKERLDQYHGVKGAFSFAIGRIKKIYPLYIFSLIVAFPIFIGLMIQEACPPVVMVNHTIHALALPGTLTQSITFSIYSAHAINGVCWFMSCIFFAYLLAIPAIRLVNKTKNGAMATLGLVLTFALIMGLSFGLGFIDGKFSIGYARIDNLVYGSPFVRFFYVLFGMFIGRLYMAVKSKKESFPAMSAVEFFLVIGVTVYFFSRTSIESLSSKEMLQTTKVLLRGADLLLVGSLVFVLAFQEGIFSRLLCSAPVQYMAKYSTHIYLLHYPVIEAWRLLFPHFLDGRVEPWKGYFGIGFVILLTATLIVVFHFEEKARHLYLARKHDPQEVTR